MPNSKVVLGGQHTFTTRKNAIICRKAIIEESTMISRFLNTNYQNFDQHHYEEAAVRSALHRPTRRCRALLYFLPCDQYMYTAAFVFSTQRVRS
mmetsp:Transcript_13527/g.25117  ORF Transcript_13527/g.25117 Transcript_13527/m.25117 type:complete len:94 (-) Transcript_13527:3316-3597(-)